MKKRKDKSMTVGDLLEALECFGKNQIPKVVLFNAKHDSSRIFKIEGLVNDHGPAIYIMES